MSLLSVRSCKKAWKHSSPEPSSSLIVPVVPISRSLVWSAPITTPEKIRFALSSRTDHLELSVGIAPHWAQPGTWMTTGEAEPGISQLTSKASMCLRSSASIAVLTVPRKLIKWCVVAYVLSTMNRTPAASTRMMPVVIPCESLAG